MEENKTLVSNIGTEQTEAANTKKEEEKKEPVTLTVEPSEFDDDAGVVFMTGAMLREKINGVFRSVFADFDCCTIGMATQNSIDVIYNSFGLNSLYVDLHFKENGVDGFHMLKHRSETKGSSMLSRINYTIGANNTRAYILDEDGLEALEEFLPGFNPKNRKKISVDQWNRRIFEQNMSTVPGMVGYGFYGGNAIDVVVTGLSLEAILKKIYGGEKDGEYFDYACSIIRGTANRDMILQIVQLKASVVNKLANMIGISNMYNYGISNNLYNYGTVPTGYQYMNPVAPQQQQ